MSPAVCVDNPGGRVPGGLVPAAVCVDVGKMPMETDVDPAVT